MEDTFSRLASKLKGREKPPPTTPAASSQDNQTPQAQNTDYNDRELALTRYKKAANQLKEAIKFQKGSWSAFVFDDLSDEFDNDNDLQFKNKINTILVSRESSVKDKKGWAKFMYAVECVFTALSPFAKNFLTATQGAQSVTSFQPF